MVSPIEVEVGWVYLIIWLNQDVSLLFLQLCMHVTLRIYFIASFRIYVYVFQHLYVLYCKARRTRSSCSPPDAAAISLSCLEPNYMREVW